MSHQVNSDFLATPSFLLGALWDCSARPRTYKLALLTEGRYYASAQSIRKSFPLEAIGTDFPLSSLFLNRRFTQVQLEE